MRIVFSAVHHVRPAPPTAIAAFEYRGLGRLSSKLLSTIPVNSVTRLALAGIGSGFLD